MNPVFKKDMLQMKTTNLVSRRTEKTEAFKTRLNFSSLTHFMAPGWFTFFFFLRELVFVSLHCNGNFSLEKGKKERKK